jgi:hypothetical protein
MGVGAWILNMDTAALARDPGHDAPALETRTSDTPPRSIIC